MPADKRVAFPQPGSVAGRIATALKGRSILERGEAAALARSLGCSRERVRQVMKRLGVPVRPVVPRRCGNCGRAISQYGKLGMCSSCRYPPPVSLVCVNCGKQFLRRRKDYNDFIRRQVTRRRVGPVCSKQCRAGIEVFCAWCGAHVGVRWPSQVSPAGRAFCSPPRRCSVQAQRALRNSWWRFLTPDLMPMKDHVEGVAELQRRIKAGGGSP